MFRALAALPETRAAFPAVVSKAVVPSRAPPAESHLILPRCGTARRAGYRADLVEAERSGCVRRWRLEVSSRDPALRVCKALPADRPASARLRTGRLSSPPPTAGALRMEDFYRWLRPARRAHDGPSRPRPLELGRTREPRHASRTDSASTASDAGEDASTNPYGRTSTAGSGVRHRLFVPRRPALSVTHYERITVGALRVATARRLRPYEVRCRALTRKFRIHARTSLTRPARSRRGAPGEELTDGTAPPGQRP